MSEKKNLCYSVEKEQGFQTISIIGKNKEMIPVVSFDEINPMASYNECQAATRAVKKWFASPVFEQQYFSRVSIAQPSPHDTWDEICNHYGLSREFEIAPPRDNL